MKVIKPLIEEISQSEVIKNNLPTCHRDIYLVKPCLGTITNNDLYVKYSSVLGSITNFDKINRMVCVTTDLTQLVDKSDLQYCCPKFIGHRERITIRFVDSIKNISKFYQLFYNFGINSISRVGILKELKDSIMNTNDIEFVVNNGSDSGFLKDEEEKIYRLIIENDFELSKKEVLEKLNGYESYLKDEIIITAPSYAFELFRDMNKNNSIICESLNQILS